MWVRKFNIRSRKNECFHMRMDPKKEKSKNVNKTKVSYKAPAKKQSYVWKK